MTSRKSGAVLALLWVLNISTHDMARAERGQSPSSGKRKPASVLVLTDKDLPAARPTKPKVPHIETVTPSKRALIERSQPAIRDAVQALTTEMRGNRRDIAAKTKLSQELVAEAQKLDREVEKLEKEARKLMGRPAVFTGRFDARGNFTGAITSRQQEGQLLYRKIEHLRDRSHALKDKSTELSREVDESKWRFKVQQADLDRAMKQKSDAKRALKIQSDAMGVLDAQSHEVVHFDPVQPPTQSNSSQTKPAVGLQKNE